MDPKEENEEADPIESLLQEVKSLSNTVDTVLWDKASPGTLGKLYRSVMELVDRLEVLSVCFFVCVCVYVFVCMFVCLFVCLCDGGHKRGVVRVRERAVTHVWIDVVSFFVDF